MDSLNGCYMVVDMLENKWAVNKNPRYLLLFDELLNPGIYMGIMIDLL